MLCSFTLVMTTAIGTTYWFHKMSKRYIIQADHIGVLKNSFSLQDTLKLKRFNIIGNEETISAKLGDLTVSKTPFATLIDKKSKQKFFFQAEGKTPEFEKLVLFLEESELDSKAKDAFNNK